MDATDKVLGMLAYMELELEDGPQLAGTLAYAGRLSPQKVGAELRRLERMGLVWKARQTKQGILWSLTVKGSTRGIPAMLELERSASD
jgi:DNA-binding MarR family transcriptional regulator